MGGVDNKNLILAVALSVGVLFLYEYFFVPEQQAPIPAEQNEFGAPPQLSAPATSGAPAAQAPQSSAPAAPAAPTISSPPAASRDAVIKGAERVRIASDRLHGSISLKGGRFDDLSFADYRETIDPDSPEIVLLSPHGTDNAYFAEFGWVATGGVAVPTPDSQWTADRETLVPGRPVTLSWSNGQGLTFKRMVSLDDDFMFTVTQTVENAGSAPVTLHPYGLVSRHGTPEVTGYMILHEGLLGVLEDTLVEVDYDEIQDSGTMKQNTTGGWLGITDKYWLTALIPDQKAAVATRFVHLRDGGADKYQTDYMGGAVQAPAGGAVTVENRLFAGAKEVRVLDGYAETLGVDRFDLAIDFGWFYFLTKPLFYGLLMINAHLGNLGLAILALTVLIKLLFFPLANKSYRAMSKMKKLQPEMKKLQERFGDDKVRMNQELMALYKREKANPASGCLPILVQIPVFFALYKVLFVTIEMRHAPFYGWIHDLSAPDPTTIFNLFGLIPWTPPDFLMLGIWPLIMGASMFLQQKLNPQPADPVQAKIFLFMPILFTVLLAQFPAGLVIYWAWNNTLSIAQQWVIMKRMGVSA